MVVVVVVVERGGVEMEESKRGEIIPVDLREGRAPE